MISRGFMTVTDHPDSGRYYNQRLTHPILPPWPSWTGFCIQLPVFAPSYLCDLCCSVSVLAACRVLLSAEGDQGFLYNWLRSYNRGLRGRCKIW